MMPNRSTDILFQLIKSLEKAEKRHFKLYIKRSSGKEDLKIVRLFDAVDKLKEYDEKVIRDFEAGAIDYLLKPINVERFQKTLERIRYRIFSGENKSLENKLTELFNNLKPTEIAYLQRITLKENGRIQFLEVEKIDWISSLGNYVEIHSGHEKFILLETMDGIESKLNPNDFLRIRRSKIVCISKIKELQTLFNGEYTVVLFDGTQLIASRRYRKNLETIL